MNRFSYACPAGVVDAVREIAARADAEFIAGATNLVDPMEYNVERPTHLMDVTRLKGLDTIEKTLAGSLRIGALGTSCEAAHGG